MPSHSQKSTHCCDHHQRPSERGSSSWLAAHSGMAFLQYDDATVSDDRSVEIRCLELSEETRGRTLSVDARGRGGSSAAGFRRARSASATAGDAGGPERVRTARSWPPAATLGVAGTVSEGVGAPRTLRGPRSGSGAALPPVPPGLQTTPSGHFKDPAPPGTVAPPGLCYPQRVLRTAACCAQLETRGPSAKNRTNHACTNVKERASLQNRTWTSGGSVEPGPLLSC